MNTGSPDAPTEEALRRYLKEFLMDPCVIDLPWPLRYAIVHWAVLPKRPAQSAEAYRSIWTDQGSPLIRYCTRLAEALRTRCTAPVEPGMAYGSPSFRDGIEKLLAAGVDELCLLPMFPHYAMATVGSCVAGVTHALRGRAALRVVPPFYREPFFIKPLADALAGADEHILFSYHGLPERHLKKSDPTGQHCLATPDCCETDSPAHTRCYRHQCRETTRAIVAAAGLGEDQYSVSFQSRLGRARWMEPYTEELLRQLPARGRRRLAVLCPSFLCDCLETLEEIDVRGRQIFLAAGGESFRLIPCLNDGPEAVECLSALMQSVDSWPRA